MAKITLEMIEANIVGEHYFSAMDGVVGAGERGADDNHKGSEAQLHLLTICVLTLKNGFMVTGTSAPVEAKNFNREIGEKVARQNAINDVWKLMGHALLSRLAGTDGVESA